MARKSGFAQVQRTMQAVAKDAQRSANARAKEHQAAVLRAQRATKAAERAAAQAARASEADRKKMEKAATAAYVASKQAEAEERTAAVEAHYEEIDGLLAATLDVDDFVDLEVLRSTATHPPFASKFETPLTPPDRLVPAPEPELALPPAPSLLGGVFGKKKHAAAVAAAENAHREAIKGWKADCQSLPARQAELDAAHAAAEAQRSASLAEDRATYDSECAEREAFTASLNAELDKLIANLGYGVPEAVEEYLSIVLANAVYPVSFPVDPSFSFDARSAELELKALVVPPDAMPSAKAYRYNKASDEITATPLTQKAQRDRYNGAVHQVALRLLHEVFEADRRGLVRTISVEVGTEAIDPATGASIYLPFVAVAAERERFMSFDLSAVVPSATLAHLGASASKNPFGLVPTDTSGIMKS